MGEIRNVLFVTFDQWRGDCLSAVGHPVIETPILDALAADGVLFANHFSNTAPCGPARASLFTGLYPMLHRSVRNGVPLDARHTNLALEARKGGFEPVLFGYTDASADPRGLSEADPKLQHYEGVLPGFEEVLRHATAREEWEAWLGRQGHEFPRGIGFNWLPDRDGVEDEPYSFAPARLPLDHWDTRFMTDKALSYLEGRGDKPWFVHLSYWPPHPPFVVPEPYNRRYNRTHVDPPVRASTPGAEAMQHPWLAYALETHERYSWCYGIETTPAEMSDEEMAQIAATYFGMINEVEECLGQIITHLKMTGQYDQTLIILTSDHGEMLGDHWMLGKMGYFDSAYHVPLIIRDPREEADSARGRIVDAMTEAVDVAPTLLELLELPIPRAMHGRSLRHWIEGDTPANWRDFVMWEYDFRDIRSGKTEAALDLTLETANLAVLRDQTSKYVHFSGLPPLFFDLEDDPAELIDRAADPAYQARVLEAAQRLLSHRMAHAERTLTHITLEDGYAEADWAL